MEALKKAWQPDTAKVDIFMNEVNSQGFAFNQDGCGAAMVDALDYLAPDGERAFESICKLAAVSGSFQDVRARTWRKLAARNRSSKWIN